MPCQKIDSNRTRCNCTYEPCSRKGNCCACLEYHRSAAELPACYFTASEEATYDRSVSSFVRSRAKRG